MKTETGALPIAATAGVRRQWHLWALALSLVLMLPACGGGSPTSPSSQVPNVAGTYTGPVKWSINGLVFYTMSGVMTVVQSGSQLTITGSWSFTGGPLDGVTRAFSAITGNVNATGFFTATGGGGAGRQLDPNCGLFTATSSTFAFSGNTVLFDETAITASCGTWLLSGTLTR